jgi:hypothetical protein
MTNKAADRPPRANEFVRLGDQHIKLPQSGVLKIGILSIDFHHGGSGGAIGFEECCCDNDMRNCVPRKEKNCADTDKPITVWRFAE